MAAITNGTGNDLGADLRAQIKRARGRGAPLIVVTTADQPAAAKTIGEACDEQRTNASAKREADGKSPLPAGTFACYSWDLVRGFYPLTEASQDEKTIEALTGGVDVSSIVNFYEAVSVAAQSSLARLCVVIPNAQRHLDTASQGYLRNVQSLQNVRDVLKTSGSTIVLLATTWSSPAELGSDVHVIDASLPDESARTAIVQRILGDVQKRAADFTFTPEDVTNAVRLTRGLSPFAAEQTVSLSTEKAGLDPVQLKSRFIAAINSTPGLTYEPESVTAGEIGGLENFKEFAQALAGSRRPFDAVIWIDEIEKALAGSSGATSDSSGASQAVLGALLTWMEERGANGLVALGPPGSGKSMCSKALGSMLGVPIVRLDVGAVKGSLVGETETNIRSLLKVVEGLAGRTFWIASCNNEASLPPELRRRFREGVWFFDLPTADERRTIWQLYLKKYDLPLDSPLPNDEGWTGAEIRNACERAYDLQITPKTAGKWIVPIARSAAEQITRLRENAAGRYVSASYDGAYRYNGPARFADLPVDASARAFDLDDN
jgi:hypothetical protein